MNWIIHGFLEITAVGSFWTPVLRISLLALAINEIVVVLLILFRIQARSVILSLKQRLSVAPPASNPPEWPPNT
jgi:hypothetical protein